ncbi:hypothetical protein OG21DRAFT_1516132 [Imleria badia]|nr:hypothetical protein OG21DRAFT_1516132 [Imleria badia]
MALKRPIARTNDGVDETNASNRVTGPRSHESEPSPEASRAIGTAKSMVKALGTTGDDVERTIERNERTAPRLVSTDSLAKGQAHHKKCKSNIQYTCS